MREDAIVLLAAASSIILITAGVARAQPGLQQRLQSASSDSSMSMTAPYRPAFQWHPSDPVIDLSRYATISTPHMIIWGSCSAPSGGSALSVYSHGEKQAPSAQDTVRQEEDCNDGCSDDEVGWKCHRGCSVR
jgi:hypothetical protein